MTDRLPDRTCVRASCTVAMGTTAATDPQIALAIHDAAV